MIKMVINNNGADGESDNINARINKEVINHIQYVLTYGLDKDVTEKEIIQCENLMRVFLTTYDIENSHNNTVKKDIEHEKLSPNITVKGLYDKARDRVNEKGGMGDERM